MTLRRLIVLNICLPLLLSLYYSLARSTSVPDPNTFKVFAVYCLSSVPMYMFAQLCSVLLRASLPNRWAILALIGGGAMSVLLGYFYLNLLVLGIEKHSAWLRGGLMMQYETFEPFSYYVLSGATLLFPVIWLLANLVYEMATRDLFFFNILSRNSGQEGGAEPSTAAPFAKSGLSGGRVGFQSRLEGELQHRLIAIEAQEHYVRAHAEDGKSQLVLYRFGDAVDELEASGHALQVHRSYCVSIEAIEEIRKSGRAQTIVLRGGMEIPVSQSYRAIVSKLGHIHAS